MIPWEGDVYRLIIISFAIQLLYVLHWRGVWRHNLWGVAKSVFFIFSFTFSSFIPVFITFLPSDYKGISWDEYQSLMAAVCKGWTVPKDSNLQEIILFSFWIWPLIQEAWHRKSCVLKRGTPDHWEEIIKYNSVLPQRDLHSWLWDEGREGRLTV